MDGQQKWKILGGEELDLRDFFNSRNFKCNSRFLF